MSRNMRGMTGGTAMRFLGVACVLAGMVVLYLGCYNGRTNIPIITTSVIIVFVGLVMAARRKKKKEQHWSM